MYQPTGGSLVANKGAASSMITKTLNIQSSQAQLPHMVAIPVQISKPYNTHSTTSNIPMQRIYISPSVSVTAVKDCRRVPNIVAPSTTVPSSQAMAHMPISSNLSTSKSICNSIGNPIFQGNNSKCLASSANVTMVHLAPVNETVLSDGGKLNLSITKTNNEIVTSCTKPIFVSTIQPMTNIHSSSASQNMQSVVGRQFSLPADSKLAGMTVSSTSRQPSIGCITTLPVITHHDNSTTMNPVISLQGSPIVISRQHSPLIMSRQNSPAMLQQENASGRSTASQGSTGISCSNVITAGPKLHHCVACPYSATHWESVRRHAWRQHKQDMTDQGPG